MIHLNIHSICIQMLSVKPNPVLQIFRDLSACLLALGAAGAEFLSSYYGASSYLFPLGTASALLFPFAPAILGGFV